MKKPTIIFTFLVFAALLPQLAAAGDDFVWEKIADKDWQVAPDSARGIRSAVMLFEKITADDHDLLNEKCYLTIYRRIKIFNAEGRKWGDFSVPYLKKKQKIEMIRGRTVLPDGREFPLLETQIFEKEILKAEGVKIKQKSFSLPGIADGCIVEYAVKYRMPSPYSVWIIQKEIPLLDGEYRWLFYNGKGWPSGFYQLLGNMLTPNYLWLNTTQKYIAEQRPSIKEPTEVFFAVNNVPAFDAEPHTLPDVALQAQLRCYYGSPTTAAAFWGQMSQTLASSLEKYTRNNKRGREVAASFTENKTKDGKIAAAYNWLQSNVRNVNYLAEDNNEEFKDNKSVDETLKRGYGTREDINFVFYDMLREMNIDAKIAYVVDRDENLFAPDAKYWQFDRSLVAVPNSNGQYNFYSPGTLHLPLTQVPWFNEGIRAFVVGSMTEQFFPVPFSSADLNRTRRMLTLQLQDESKVHGKLTEQRFGHGSRSLRVVLAQTPASSQCDKLQEELENVLSKAQLDSISATGTDGTDRPLILNCNLKMDMNAQPLGTTRLLVRPFSLFKPDSNAFQANTRRYAIMFDYAHELVETMQIDLPENWKIDALPADSSFSNKAGECQLSFQNFGKTLSAQRMFRLNRPFWQASDYADVKTLFQARLTMGALAVVLRKPE
ncbi:DUF3857 domain-containing protein [candidate division KSB1 bacterium]|nr:DUF3857 domain-containing protein [candidate division KSB1 bacterium]